ncbi:MAG: hypothetical protein K5683_02755 [Prevotella sp.]|nr:hypothetical protein [Prevotella sp.]
MEINKTTFDDLAYFKELGEKNLLAKANGFFSGYCSGPDGLDQVMAEYRDYANFILVDDTTSGNTFGAKPGWFDRKVYAVYIIAGYEYGNEDDYKAKLALCRQIFKQMLSRVIRDKAQMTYGKAMMYMNLETIFSQEYGRYSFNGATGLFFQLQNNEPLNLVYDANEWEE